MNYEQRLKDLAEKMPDLAAAMPDVAAFKQSQNRKMVGQIAIAGLMKMVGAVISFTLIVVIIGPILWFNYGQICDVFQLPAMSVWEAMCVVSLVRVLSIVAGRGKQ